MKDLNELKEIRSATRNSKTFGHLSSLLRFLHDAGKRRILPSGVKLHKADSATIRRDFSYFWSFRKTWIWDMMWEYLLEFFSHTKPRSPNKRRFSRGW